MLIPRPIRLLYALPIWAYAISAAGCVTRGGMPGAGMHWNEATKSWVRKPVPGDDFWFLTPLAAACVAGGVLALIASTFIPLIPRKAAFTAIAIGIACAMGKSFLTKFSPAMNWALMALIVVGGVVVAWPIATGWVRYGLIRRSDELRADDPRAATALRVAALPHRFKDKVARKGLLAKLGG